MTTYRMLILKLACSELFFLLTHFLRPQPLVSGIDTFGTNLQAPSLVIAGDVPALFQVPDHPGQPDPGALENLEEYPAVPTSHGRLEFLPPFACIVCFEVFRNDNQLLEHGRNAGHRPYSCNCGRTYSRLYALTRHLSSRSVASVTGSVGAKHSCPLCTKYDGESGFNRRDHLRQHLRVFHKLDKKGMESIMDSIGRSAPAPAEAVNDAAGT
ncbi:hypothetical protein F4680DRAFT_421684 [Xylaria scruposa]|nr:hypothetical protein F4680DRAFT_421684 [Xylaria scruposa]